MATKKISDTVARFENARLSGAWGGPMDPINRGIAYEDLIFRKIKRLKLCPPNFTKPEQISGQDITIEKNGIKFGIEVKHTSNAAFGSGTLKFDTNLNTDPWSISEKTLASELMTNLNNRYHIEREVNSKWYSDNGKYYPRYLVEKTESNAKIDQKVLGEIRINNIDIATIKNYYISKGTYYIHIKGKGFYWFGDEDPLGIKNSITEFNARESFIRIRMQKKSSSRSNYRFAFEFYIRGITPSKNLKGLDGNLDFLLD